MGSGTLFNDILKLVGNKLPNAAGPTYWTACNAIAVRVVQVQTLEGEGAVAIGSGSLGGDLTVTPVGGGALYGEWAVPLTQLSARDFEPGAAQASAVAEVDDNGTTRIVEWSHEVMLEA